MLRYRKPARQFEDRHSVISALIGSIATMYYQIADLNHRIDLNDQSIAYAEKTLKLVQVSKEAGDATRLEIAEAEQNLQNQKAGSAALIEQRVEVRNALSVLLNGTHWPEDQERSRCPTDLHLP